MRVPTGEIVNLSRDEIARMQHEEAEALEQLQDDGHVRRVLEKEKLVELLGIETEKLKPLSQKRRKGWMRNQACVCGSGVKFKRCCWSKFK